jgi:O-methyltransferase
MTVDHETFRHQQREYIFLSIARFCHLNRLLEGYYFEFGCHTGRTMCMAWNFTKDLFNWTYVGFDSFQGLPEMPEIDQQPIWYPGKLATSEEDFHSIVEGNGMPLERLVTVKGFYDQSLTSELAERFLPKKAAVIYVDCDLYSSTVPVLSFCKPFLQAGTVIVFDDWFCFFGDPNRGERRAWAEFCQSNPGLRSVSFVSTNEAQSFVCLGNEKPLRKTTAPGPP